MTNPDPSSPLEDDALDFLGESLDSKVPQVEPSELPDEIRDEDRLYTDDFIRQNERASRTLLLSFVCAGVISVGVGIWYFIMRQNQPQPNPNMPLQVPAQPSFMPPSQSSSLPSINPQLPGQPLPPTDSGVMPSGKPDSKVPPSPSPGLSTPPPPPQ